MPPKAAPKKADGPSKKTEQKKKEKVIEDKTFGLKNKKGAKQQKFIKNVTTQVQHGNKNARQISLLEKDKKKDDKKKEQEELNNLFKPVVQQQKVAFGVDPKSVLCAFFKQGQCFKGDRCKFSHDLQQGRKAEKKSIYEDTAKPEENMDTWDEAKLEEVVNTRHGADNLTKPKTAIICKFFLEAVEENKYGWFWNCPNGNDKCHYKHALPPGFILKKDKKNLEKEQISIEDLVEKERAALGISVTKVTLESFLQWKERKRKEKKEKTLADDNKKKSDYKAGKIFGISGRDLFTFNPDLLLEQDDDEGGEVFVYKREEEEEDGVVVHEINLDSLAEEENDNTGTTAPAAQERLTNGVPDTSQGESAKLDMAAAMPSSAEIATQEAINAAVGATVNGELLADDVPIDEHLFDGEDLDLIDEDLDTLDLSD